MNLFPAVRAGYGALLLLAPDRVIRLYAGHPADGARTVARLLGARHLTQAALTVGNPSRTVLALGVEADLAHAASMAGLGAGDRARRRAALIDALGAGSFAVVGAVLVRRDSSRSARAVGDGAFAQLAALRETAAAWLAGWLLPAPLRPPG